MEKLKSVIRKTLHYVDEGMIKTWGWVKPKILPLGTGFVVGVIYVSSEFVPSSDVIAPSPDRIIPAASSYMAEGALNPNLLELRVCDAYPKEPGQELLFVYDGKKQVGTVGSDGNIVTTPYEGESWRCS